MSDDPKHPIGFMVIPIEDCPIHGPKSKESDGEKASSGVVSNKYRDGWEAIFGKKTIGEA